MSPVERRRLLRRLQAQFAAAVARGSEIHDTPGYRVHLWPSPDPFYRNVAVPTSPTACSAAAAREMARLFAQAERTPRLEFFAELWPGLPAVLEATGFALERRADVMTRSTYPALASTQAMRVVNLDGGTPRPLLASFLAGAQAAFGEEEPLLAPGELERLAGGLRAGSILAATVLEDGEPVAGASLVAAGEVAELIGVWCRPACRRRGYAGAACGAAIERFGERGGRLVWLSSSEPASTGLYAGLGFTACGTQLNYAGSDLALT